jgi:hypothetical protein
LVVVTPAGLNLAISKANPSPSRAEILMGYRQILEHTEPTPEMVRLLVKRYGLQGISEDDVRAKNLALREFAQTQISPKMAEIVESARQRDRTMAIAGMLNPAVALNTLLVKLAGQDGTSFRDFDEYLRAENACRSDFFVHKRLTGYRMTRDDYAEIPTLQTQPAPSGPSADEIWPLRCWIALLFAVSFATTIKRK